VLAAHAATSAPQAKQHTETTDHPEGARGRPEATYITTAGEGAGVFVKQLDPTERRPAIAWS
jgi:hypothetical protein